MLVAGEPPPGSPCIDAEGSFVYLPVAMLTNPTSNASWGCGRPLSRMTMTGSRQLVGSTAVGTTTAVTAGAGRCKPCRVATAPCDARAIPPIRAAAVRMPITWSAGPHRRLRAAVARMRAIAAGTRPGTGSLTSCLLDRILRQLAILQHSDEFQVWRRASLTCHVYAD